MKDYLEELEKAYKVMGAMEFQKVLDHGEEAYKEFKKAFDELGKLINPVVHAYNCQGVEVEKICVQKIMLKEARHSVIKFGVYSSALRTYENKNFKKED